MPYDKFFEEYDRDISNVSSKDAEIGKLQNVLVEALKTTPENDEIFSLTTNSNWVRWVYKSHETSDFSKGLIHHFHLVVETRTPEDEEKAKKLLQPFEEQWKREKHDDIPIECTQMEGKKYYSIVISGLDHGKLTHTTHTQYQEEGKTGKGRYKTKGPRHKGCQAVIDYSNRLKNDKEIVNRWPKDETGMPQIALFALSAYIGDTDSLCTITGNCNTEKFINGQLSTLKAAKLSFEKNGRSIEIPDSFFVDAVKVHDFLYRSLGIGNSAEPTHLKPIGSGNIANLDSALSIQYEEKAYSPFTGTYLEKQVYQSNKTRLFEQGGKAVPADLAPSVFLTMPLDKLAYRVLEYKCNYPLELQEYFEGIEDPQKRASEEKYFEGLAQQDKDALNAMKQAGWDYQSRTPEAAQRLSSELVSAATREHQHLSALCGYDTSQSQKTELLILDDSSEGEKPRGRSPKRESPASRSSSQERSWEEAVSDRKNSRSSSQSPTRS
jgi:hypothetical protein